MWQGKVLIPTVEVGAGVQAAEAMAREGTVSPDVEEKPLQHTAECARNQTAKTMNRKRNACWYSCAVIKFV